MFSRFPKVVGARLIADGDQRITDLRKRRLPVNLQRMFLVSLCSALLVSCAGKVEQQPTQQAQATPPAAPQPREHLRVCADPNNLPFSNERGEGFENKIAALVAREMNTDVQYTWWAQRRGFVRNTLKAGECDLIVGVPLSFEMASTT